LDESLADKGYSWVVHNGDQDRVAHPTRLWGQTDVLIYSPSIGAGVSFTEPHFDVLFAYIENSFYTPTIDFVLQQLFRVRQLKRGDMFLYVNDGFLTEEAKGRFPTHHEEIDKWMDANIMCLPDQYCSTISYESGQTVDHMRQCLAYDKTNLSYLVLRGIVAMKNASLVHFVGILQKTLVEDYDIPCKMEEIGPDVVGGLSETKSKTKRLPAFFNPKDFVSSMVLSKIEYHRLSRLSCDKKTDFEKHLMWIHEAVVCLWRVHPEKVDTWFYENCIGCQERQIKKAKEAFAKGLRWHVATTNEDIANIITMLEVELKSIGGDVNMSLFHNNPMSFYQMIIEGKAVLEHVFGPESLSCLSNEGSFQVEMNECAPRFKEYIASLSSKRFGQLRNLMGMDKRAYPSLEKLASSRVNQNAFVAKVLEASFGIKFRLMRRTTVNQQWQMDNKWFRDIVRQYEPAIFC